MAYCAQADVQNRVSAADLVALSDHDGDGSADAAVVARAIADGDAEIDSYLGVRYGVPLTTVPAAVKVRSVNMAVYYLQMGRQSVTEDAREQYKADVAWLKGVAAGSVSLGIAPKPAEASGAASVQIDVADRVFGRDEPL